MATPKSGDRSDRPDKPDKDSALTEDEIKTALKAQGYPFEIELLEGLASRGLETTVGFRLPVGDGPIRPPASDEPDETSLTREVDVLGQLDENIIVPHFGKTEAKQVAIGMKLAALVEAKALPRTRAFVGLVWRQPPLADRRSLRCWFGGIPSFQVVGGDGDAASFCLHDGGLAPALDALNEAPFCVQWALVGRKASGEAYAGHGDMRLANGINNLVRGVQRLNVGDSAFIATHSGYRLYFYMPTLFFRTSCLYLYDALTDKLTTTDRLVLQRTFDIGDGVVNRLIDVVSWEGLDGFAESYKRAMHGLKSAVGANADELLRVADAQRERVNRELLREATEEWRRIAGAPLGGIFSR